MQNPCGGVAVITAFIISTGFSFSVLAQEGGDRWSLEFDKSGNVVKVRILGPQTTYLRTQKEIVEEIDQSGQPVSGYIIFNESTYYGAVRRDMTPMEVTTYWKKFDGPRLLWNYWESQGKLVTITSGTIPGDWFGKEVRLIYNVNNQVIGILGHSEKPDEYLIKDKDACCGPTRFDMDGIGKLQKVKQQLYK